MRLKQYFSIGNALVNLMDPLVEVVIHCLHTNKIVFIEGILSKRSVGDPSLLDGDTSNVGYEAYAKLNFDGRLIRSISVPIKENDIVIALMCINYDITALQELNTLTSTFLGKSLTKGPDVLFRNDWQDRIHQCIYKILKERNLQFDAMTNKDKKAVVHYLYEQGAFSEKNAAEYIAKILNMGRATIFNHLQICRKDNNAS